MKLRWIILIVLAVAGAAWGVWHSMQPQAELAVVRPKVERISEFVEEQGVTELPRSYLISMPINGWLEPITLREGDAVKKDQVVARLEQDNPRSRQVQAQQRVVILTSQVNEIEDNRLEDSYLLQTEDMAKGLDEMIGSALANIESIRAMQEYTAAELNRLQSLVTSRATTESDLDRIKMENRQANADYKSETFKLNALRAFAAVSHLGPKLVKDYRLRKQFTLEQCKGELLDAKEILAIAQRDLDRSIMKAPEDSVVLQRHQTRRQFLSAGTPLLTLGNLKDLEVTAEVLTERAMKIEPGDKVEVYGEGLPEGTTTGKVLHIYPAGFKKISSLGVEQQRVKVAIRLEEVPPRLGVDFRVYVRIYYDAIDGALTVPRTCLVRDKNGGWNVIVVRAGKTAVAPITVGLMNEDRVQIVEGIDKNDQVVIRPDRDIRSGITVTTVEE